MTPEKWASVAFRAMACGLSFVICNLQFVIDSTGLLPYDEL